MLLMMNAPTSSATTAKTVMNSEKNVTSSLVRLPFSSASAVPVMAWSSAGSTASTRFASWAWSTPSSASSAMPSTRPSPPSSRSAVVGAEQHGAVAGPVVLAGEGGDADDGHVLRRRAREHRGAVADREVGRVGGRPVHDDLVGAPRRPPGDQLERVEPLVRRPRRAGGRGSATEVVDRLAVGPEDLGEALEPRRDGGHAIDGRQVGGQRRPAPARAGCPGRS